MRPQSARHACSPCKARPTVILECATAALPRKTNAEHTVTPHAAFPNYAFAAAGPRAETYVFTCIMEGAPERPFLVFSSIAALSPCITNDEQSSRSVVFRWLRKRPPEAHMCSTHIVPAQGQGAHRAPKRMRTWDLDMFFPGAPEPHQNVDFAASEFYTTHRWSRKTLLLRRTTAFQMVLASPLLFENSTTVFRTRNRPCKGMWRSRKQVCHSIRHRRTCLSRAPRAVT